MNAMWTILNYYKSTERRNGKMKRIWCICCLAALGLGAVKAQSNEVEKMFPNAVISRKAYDKVVDAIKKQSAGFPLDWYKRQVETPAGKLLAQTPNPMKSVTDNPNNVDATAEMKNIHLLCLNYAFTQDERYLNKAVEFLKAWAAVNVSVPKSNIHEEKYDIAAEGYSIIRKLISEADRTLIDGWLRQRINTYIKDVASNNNTFRANNWGTCMIYQYYLLGTVLEDKGIVDIFKNTYPTWVKSNLFPNGTTNDLLGRDAFAYHGYDLMFFARICHLLAMNEGYEAADELYSRDINWGASIRKSVNYWKPFMMDTKKYAHLEFIDTESAWDKTNQSSYNQAYNPAHTLYSVCEIYEFDNDLKRILDHFGYGATTTLKMGLSYLRWTL